MANFLTPGGAMSQVLQGTIERDRNIERQQLLDALNAQKIQAEIENQKINSEALADQRKSYAAQMRAQAEQRNVNTFDEGQFGIGTDLAGRFDPEMEATLKKFGRITATNPNAGKGNEEDYIEGVFSAGSPDERNRQRKKEALKSLASQLGDPSLVAQFSAFADLDDNITGGEISSFLKPQTKPVYRTKADGTIEKVGDVPANAQMTQVDRPVQGPQGPTPQLVQIEDPQNPGKYFQRWVTPGDDKGLQVPSPNAPTPPSGPTSPGAAERQRPAFETPQASNQPRSAPPIYRGNVPQSAANPRQSSISGAEVAGLRSALAAQQKMNNASTQGALFTTQNQIISKYLPSDELKQAARSILAFEDRDKYSTQDLIGFIKGNRAMTPAETEALNDVITTILGRF